MVGSGGGRPTKKLSEAAAYWARGGHEFDQARADLKAWATPESIDQIYGPDDPNFEVWPENGEALCAFLNVQTQWVVGMSGPTGLDYTRVESGLRLAGIAATPELFEKLRTLERAALDALNNKPQTETKDAAK